MTTKSEKKGNKKAKTEKPEKYAEETKKKLKAIAGKNGVKPKTPEQVEQELAAAVKGAEAERLAQERTIVDLRPDRRSAKKAAGPKPEKAGKRYSIRQLIIETITANPAATNAEMIAAVRKEFPESAFKDTHAAWYRSQARKGSLTGARIPMPAMGRKQSKASD